MLEKNTHIGAGHVRSRAGVDIVIFLAVLSGSWWLVGALLFAGMLFYRNFYEAFFFGLAFDLLYGIRLPALHEFQFIFSTLSLVLVLVIERIKSRVRI